MSKVIENALKAIGEQINALPKNERAEFIEALACLSIGLLRGRFGDEFAGGFLTSALEDVRASIGTSSASRPH
jgi:hypothetical protein